MIDEDRPNTTPDDDSEEPRRPEIAPGALDAATRRSPSAAGEDTDEAAAAAAATDATVGAGAVGATADPAQPAVDAAVATTPAAEAGESTHPAAEAGDSTGPLSVDVADPDAEALSAIPLRTRIEALLFAATEPLPLRRLKELSACPDARAVRDAIDAYARECDAAGRAYRVEEVAQGFQLRTTDAVAPVVARLGRRPTEERLSTAALETLAVVAYRQPAMRVDVERIRGVACGEVLRALQERGLVRIAGRADLPGSPLLYGTTQRFLEIFGLRDVQDLPRDRELLRPRDGA